MNGNRKIVILYSGGLDSRILLHYAKLKQPESEIIPVYWNYGHNAANAEMAHLPPEVIVRNLEWFQYNGELRERSGDPSGAIYIPGRNMAFAVNSACQFLPDEIWFGALAEEDTPAGRDKNLLFRNKMTDVFSYVLSEFKESDDPILMRAPFAEEGMSKDDIIAWAVSNDLPLKRILEESHSCYHIQDTDLQECGDCKQCFRRLCYTYPYGINIINGMTQNPLYSESNRKWIDGMITEIKEKGKNTSCYYDVNWDGLYGFITNEIREPDEWISYLIQFIKDVIEPLSGS